MENGEDPTYRPLLFTGWGTTAVGEFRPGIAHAVAAAEESPGIAVCGARVLDVDRRSPWEPLHADVACRRCAEVLRAQPSDPSRRAGRG